MADNPEIKIGNFCQLGCYVYEIIEILDNHSYYDFRIKQIHSGITTVARLSEVKILDEFDNIATRIFLNNKRLGEIKIDDGPKIEYIKFVGTKQVLELN